MAERDQDLNKSPQLQLPDGSSLRLSDSTNDLDVRKEGDTLFLQLSRNERSLFSISVLGDGQIHQVFNAASVTPATGHLLAQTAVEVEKPPEYPPITIEGFAGRQGSYRDSDIHKDEKEYYVYLYYRPTPEPDWKFVIPYHVHFFGSAAEKLKAQKVETGARLRVTGELHERQIRGKNGEPSKMHYDVYATEPPEYFKGRPQPLPGETRRRSG